MVKRINKRVHIEKNQLLLYQGGVMTMLIMGTGVVYTPVRDKILFIKSW